MLVICSVVDPVVMMVWCLAGQNNPSSPLSCGTMQNMILLPTMTYSELPPLYVHPCACAWGARVHHQPASTFTRAGCSCCRQTCAVNCGRRTRLLSSHGTRKHGAAISGERYGGIRTWADVARISLKASSRPYMPSGHKHTRGASPRRPT